MLSAAPEVLPFGTPAKTAVEVSDSTWAAMSNDERKALWLLTLGPYPSIPKRLARRLVALGVAEPSFDHVRATIAGRQLCYARHGSSKSEAA
jgi:hypothetical protein